MGEAHRGCGCRCVDHGHLLFAAALGAGELLARGWIGVGLVEELQGLLEPDVAFLAASELLAYEGHTLALIVEILRGLNNWLREVIFLRDEFPGSFIHQELTPCGVSTIEIVEPELLFKHQLLLVLLQFSDLFSDGLSIRSLRTLKVEVKELIYG